MEVTVEALAFAAEQYQRSNLAAVAKDDGGRRRQARSFPEWSGSASPVAGSSYAHIDRCPVSGARWDDCWVVPWLWHCDLLDAPRRLVAIGARFSIFEEDGPAPDD
jgi:hypothetical protein